MKIVRMTAFVFVMSIFMSCAVFIHDDDDDHDIKKRDSSKDTITIIYSNMNGNPLSAR